MVSFEKLTEFNIDVGSLSEHFDYDSDFFSSCILELEKNYRKMLNDLDTAMMRQDSGDVEHCAHALKGMLSNFYCKDLSGQFLTIEKIGRAGDLETIDFDKELLQGNIDRFIEVLKKTELHMEE